MVADNYKNLNDLELIKEFLAKKTDYIFEEIYNRYNKGIYNYMRKLLYYSKDSFIEDLINDVFIKVYLNISTLRDLSRFKNWIFQIAHNLCINYIKSARRKKETELLDDFFPDKKDSIEDHYLKNETKNFVFNEIGKYDNTIREIIILKFYQGMTYDEISEITGISVRSLKYELKKTLDDLNLKLKAEGLY